MSAADRSRKPTFFAAPADLRRWLQKHHARAAELWVGYYKKGSGLPSITWPESVDEALCFGWIDGIRKSLDGRSYVIRFTPRKTGSTWSAVNIRRARALADARRMRAAGRKAFAARLEKKSGIYAYEQRHEGLQEPYESLLRKNSAAWRFFQAQPPGYRKKLSWWVMSARKEETRLARLARLAEESARGRRL